MEKSDKQCRYSASLRTRLCGILFPREDLNLRSGFAQGEPSDAPGENERTPRRRKTRALLIGYFYAGRTRVTMMGSAKVYSIVYKRLKGADLLVGKRVQWNFYSRNNAVMLHG